MDVTERVIISPNKKISASKTMTIGVTDSTHISQKRRYSISNIIGEGAYSKVHLAYKIENGYKKRIACKVINKGKMSGLTLYKFLPREMSIIKTLVHPHIVTVYDTKDIDGHLYIFMEICEGGNLFEYIQKRGHLKACKARHLFRQLVSAVDYLHAQDICHRDLKCENILLSSKDCVKLADFGFARRCQDNDGRCVLSNTFCGSLGYTAPEVIQRLPYDPKLADTWSLGCILFIMLTGKMPFGICNVPAMLQNQISRQLIFPQPSELYIQPSAKILIRSLLEPDVERRATIKQVNRSLWL